MGAVHASAESLTSYPVENAPATLGVPDSAEANGEAHAQNRSNFSPCLTTRPLSGH